MRVLDCRVTLDFKIKIKRLLQLYGEMIIKVD